MPLRFSRPTILAVNASAQLHAWLEMSRVPRGERHDRSGPGIAPDPRAAESQREAAEAADLDAPSPGETLRHVINHHLHRELDVSLGELGLLLRDATDEFGLGHRTIVARPLWDRDPPCRRGCGEGTPLVRSPLVLGCEPWCALERGRSIVVRSRASDPGACTRSPVSALRSCRAAPRSRVARPSRRFRLRRRTWGREGSRAARVSLRGASRRRREGGSDDERAGRQGRCPPWVVPLGGGSRANFLFGRSSRFRLTVALRIEPSSSHPRLPDTNSDRDGATSILAPTRVEWPP